MAIRTLPSGGLVLVPRIAFEAGEAQCILCRAYVRPVGEMTQALVRRCFGEHAAAGECPACETVTYFALE